MYKTDSELSAAIDNASDEKLLRDKIIDELIFTAVFAENPQLKAKARSAIRQIANDRGAISSSIYGYYMAIGNGEVSAASTVPAINVRALTYDTARIIFRLMMEKQIGPVVFEIARSEIEYTDQRPDEYSVSVLAAAVKEGYRGPVFIQGDHFQMSAKKYAADPQAELGKIKDLIKESLAADFKNIDIDASTLVDLSKADPLKQQSENYKVTSAMTSFIRSLEKGTAVSIGAEIGHIGGKNSTAEELDAFMQGYLQSVTEGAGISKISVQTGTSHGGIPLADGTMAEVKLDFDVIEKTGEAARGKYKIGGVVQHGASTLPNALFDQFPKHKTLEIHLATGFQNIVFDNMPQSLRDKMYAWLDAEHQAEWDDTQNHDQNIYKTRKRAIGQFKKEMWQMSEAEKKPIRENLEKQLRFLFEKLNIANTRQTLEKYV